MKETRGDIWDYSNKGEWIVITTNGTIKSNGAIVMGRGVAKQALDRFPQVAFKLGEIIKEVGNHCCALWDLSLISFPVKHNWYEKADINLVKRSCTELVELIKEISRAEPGEEKSNFYMVRPGCGNGGLDWIDVRKEIEPLLPDRVIIVENKEV